MARGGIERHSSNYYILGVALSERQYLVTLVSSWTGEFGKRGNGTIGADRETVGRPRLRDEYRDAVRRA